MQKHFAATSYLLCHGRWINNANVTVQEFSNNTVLNGWVLYGTLLHDNVLNIVIFDDMFNETCGVIFDNDFMENLLMSLSAFDEVTE